MLQQSFGPGASTSSCDPTRFDPTRAKFYDFRHRRSPLARFKTWRERRCVSRALRDAGSPETVLDLPCGTGRFWPAFASAGVVELTAADNSQPMLDVAEDNRLNADMPGTLLKCSAFAIDLPDNCVEVSVCLRFFQHLAMEKDRRNLLSELNRVSSTGHILLSTMVSGNYVGNRKMRSQTVPATPGYGRRFVRNPAELAEEFRKNGFRIIRYYDSVPLIDCWRFYLLQGHKESPGEVTSPV